MDLISHIVFLEQEILYLTSLLRPEDTGHIRTAINVLEEHKSDLKKSLPKLESALLSEAAREGDSKGRSRI